MRLLIVTHYFWPENFRVNDLAEECVELIVPTDAETVFPSSKDWVAWFEFEIGIAAASSRSKATG